MTPHERIKRYAQLVTALSILVWGLLCFLVLVAPRTRRLNRLQGELTKASKQLADMEKEIENAAIVGAPAAGESRYEKFGILGADEEQLFLSDLIAFCKESRNTLDVVRRADVARSAVAASDTGERKPTGSGRPAAAQPAPASSPGGPPTAPQPIVEKVPHTVNYSGTFLSSFHLLRKLESYKRLLTVERVEVGTDSRYGHPRVNGNITIDLYLVKNPGAPPPPPATEQEKAQPASSASRSADTGDQE